MSEKIVTLNKLLEAEAEKLTQAARFALRMHAPILMHSRTKTDALGLRTGRAI